MLARTTYATDLHGKSRKILLICVKTLQNTTGNVAISGLIHRTDELSMGNKVIETNRIIKSFVSSRDVSFIDNDKIGSSMRNRSGVHLNHRLDSTIADN